LESLLDVYMDHIEACPCGVLKRCFHLTDLRRRCYLRELPADKTIARIFFL